MEEGIAEVQYKESEKEEGSCGRRDSLHVSIGHSGQRHTAHGAEERARRGGISETGPDWGATLVHVSGCARACHPCHHPSLLATHALPPPAIKMRSSGRCLPPSFLPSATKNAHATTMTREAEPRPRRDKKPSERKEKGRASEQGMPLFCGLAFNLIQPPRTPTEEGARGNRV